MKKRIIAVVSVLLILAFVCSFFGCGTRANWAAQKSDTKMNELNLREANGSEKYIIFAALDEEGDLIASGSSAATASYAVVGYTGLVAELIIPDEFAPTGGEAKPVTKVLAVDPYSDYKCYRNGVPYTGEDARLQNNTVVTTLSFGANMTYVGAGVCAGMTNLYDVIFSGSSDAVETGDRAFAACPNLSHLTYSRTENYISFGTYPQTKVVDNTIITALNARAGTLPTASNSQNWTSYHYYYHNGGFVTSPDFMWYIDIDYNGSAYRGVYFLHYRPEHTGQYFNDSGSNSKQDENGYEIGNVYWFKFEAIKWRILSESNGEILIFAESIIDAQAYQNTLIAADGGYYNNSAGTPSGTYANNYRYSTLRIWLNDTFYNTAFNSFQKSLILSSNVDNSARSSNTNNNATYYNGGVNPFACENTQDAIFLLSFQEVTNASYGFATYAETNNAIRRKSVSDYAKAQGVHVNQTYDTGSWWLRSPRHDQTQTVRHVNVLGYAAEGGSIIYKLMGVVPAMRVKPA